MKIGFIEIKINNQFKPTMQNILLIVLYLLLIIVGLAGLMMLGFLLLICSALVLEFITQIPSSTDTIGGITLSKYILILLIINTCMSIGYYKIGKHIVEYVNCRKRAINDLFGNN